MTIVSISSPARLPSVDQLLRSSEIVPLIECHGRVLVTKAVREVLNELEINDRSTLRDYAKDVWITAQLKFRLLGDKNVLAINYTVDTLNGVVFLFGIAQDKKELDRATSHARNIKGVVKVISHVVLKDAPKRAS